MSDTYDIQEQESANHDKKDRAALSAQIEADDLKWLMGSKRGRRIVRRQLERAGIWQSSFNTNALVMAHNEGRRNEGLALTAAIMQHCPERYNDMITEKTE